MRTKTLHTVAVTLGLSVCTIAQADSPYSAPSKWNNFRTVADTGEAVPVPAAELPAPSTPFSQPSAPQATASVGTGYAPSQSSPYSQAIGAPWVGSTGGACSDGACGKPARPALSPWFGGADVLFYTLETDRGSALAYDGTNTTNIWSGAVDPDASVGFDVFAGRYLDCGRFGLGVGYTMWDPSSESTLNGGITAGTLRANQLGYNNVQVDAGLGAGSAYGIIDGTDAAYAGAEGIRLRRDLNFQGIEANLYSFGLMGARRAAYADCDPCNKGYGGAAGPLARACSGRIRIMTSHGFRWFQVNDEFEAAYNVDGNGGYQADDIYDQFDVENNLYGYQFGGMLTYCLGCRMNLNIGGKFGIYGNDVDVRHRLGTENNVATVGGADINTTNSDVVLATLGELDLGLGLRLTNRWSVRGGYRLMGISGVVDAVEAAQGTDFQSLATASEVYADDSFILHGGYVGLTCNW
jgi:hypothetical protein